MRRHYRGSVLPCLAAIVAIALVGPGAGVARPLATDITGTWRCCGAGGAAAQDFIITSGKGALAGRAQLPSGKVFASITGSASGNAVTITTTYNSFAPGYVAVLVGTLSSNGNAITGTWKDNRGQVGTFTATRVGKPAPKPAKPPAAAPGKIVVPAGQTLSQGDSSAAVTQLQKALAALGLYKGKVDGVFGKDLTAAVTAYQKSKGLTPDGAVGPDTAAKINATVAKK